jgi:hypothetical protein
MEEQTMINTTEIRRLANGAIDTNYYARIGHQCRSETVYAGGRAFVRFGSALLRKAKQGFMRPTAHFINDTFARI